MWGHYGACDYSICVDKDMEWWHIPQRKGFWVNRLAVQSSAKERLLLSFVTRHITPCCVKRQSLCPSWRVFGTTIPKEVGYEGCYKRTDSLCPDWSAVRKALDVTALFWKDEQNGAEAEKGLGRCATLPSVGKYDELSVNTAWEILRTVTIAGREKRGREREGEEKKRGERGRGERKGGREERERERGREDREKERERGTKGEGGEGGGYWKLSGPAVTTLINCEISITTGNIHHFIKNAISCCLKTIHNSVRKELGQKFWGKKRKKGNENIQRKSIPIATATTFSLYYFRKISEINNTISVSLSRVERALK